MIATERSIAPSDQTIVGMTDMHADNQFNLADIILGLQQLSGQRQTASTPNILAKPCSLIYDSATCRSQAGRKCQARTESKTIFPSVTYTVLEKT